MKNNNKKITIILISFLLLIPFRLPVSVVLIRLFNSIAQLEGTLLPMNILRANVIMTKLVYNIIFASLTVHNLEMLTRSIKKRKSTEIFYTTTGLVGFGMIVYLVFDLIWTYELFTALN